MADEQLARSMALLPKPPIPTARPNSDAEDPNPPNPDREGWDDLRELRVEALFWLGAWQRAYDELPSPFDTFDQLAELMLGDARWRDLESLLARHRMRYPDDPALIDWQVKLHWHRKDYAKIRPLIEPFLKDDAEQKVDDDTLVLGVRAMIRRGEAQALRKLLANTNPIDMHFTKGMVIAAARGPDELLAFCDARIEPTGREGSEALRWELYRDKDLQALLASPEFESIRRKYPQPSSPPKR